MRLGLVAGFVYGRDQAGQRGFALMFHSRATGAEVDLNLTHPGDLVVTMGAGDVWRFGQTFLDHLTEGD